MTGTPSSLTALVLCGGRASRLQSAIRDRPKFLAPICGRVFADYLLEYLRAQSVTEVVLCTGHMAEQVEDYCGEGSRWGLHIRYSHERQPLGTAGALKNAQSLLLSDPFWVINGDSFTDARLDAVYSLHVQKRAIVTLLLTEVTDVSRFGAVAVYPDGRVAGFAEKARSGSGCVSAGIYLMSRSVLDEIPFGCFVSLEHDILPTLVGKGLYAYIGRGLFVDIGTQESLHRAQELLHRWPAAGS